MRCQGPAAKLVARSIHGRPRARDHPVPTAHWMGGGTCSNETWPVEESHSGTARAATPAPYPGSGVHL
eukprot:10974620-Alexandrium_andersonii.AAC.1